MEKDKKKLDYPKKMSCPKMPLFYNGTYNGLCERTPQECFDCIELYYKNNKK